MRAQRGFSLVELLVAVALTGIVLAAVFAAIDPANGSFAIEPEAADMQQRLRVATHTLAEDLLTAGARSAASASPGGGAAPFPAVLPYRAGPLDAAPPAAAVADVITVVSVPATAVETTIADAIRAPSAATTVVTGPGCPRSDVALNPACGLRPGTMVLVRDQHGFDLFTVSALAGSIVSLEQVRHVLARPFEAGSRIVEVAATTYYLRTDEQARTSTLMRYNGRSSDAPVVDNVVSLAFEYFGEAGGAGLALALDEVARNPPPIVRRVRVRVRIQAAAESLRGPAGALFLHGGSARQARRWAPDLGTTVDVALRNAGLDP